MEMRPRAEAGRAGVWLCWAGSEGPFWQCLQDCLTDKVWTR